MIQVSGVTKTYQLNKKQKKELQTNVGSISAVNDISFTCKPGKVFSLLGPNGAGKTTLLRMIATILTPTQGEITVNGISTNTASSEVRKHIGFLTGSTNLYDKLTPKETVIYFGQLYGMSKGNLNKRMNYLFDKLDIQKYAAKRINQLSTGMKQRVSIARSMIHDPDVVIFDEPTSGLDVISASSIIELIRDCKNQGKTVIFSSHIMSEVDLLCDELVIINNGKLVYNDTIESYRQLSENKSLTETFIKIVSEQPINS